MFQENDTNFETTSNSSQHRERNFRTQSTNNCDPYGVLEVLQAQVRIGHVWKLNN